MTQPLSTILLAIGLIAYANAQVHGDERPNIVLVMADDQGYGDVGFRDHPHLRTPVMDEMAANGLRFDRFYAAAPVCSPTRGSVMTGRHPIRFGCFSWGHRLRPQERTLAELLQAAGYTTGHFGKWHLGSVEAGAATSPGHSGFDRWVSSPNFYENSPLLSDEGRVIETVGESSEVTVDFAVSFMRDSVEKQKPFLAVVWFGSPHGPHQSLAELRSPYADLPERQQHFYGEIAGMDQALGKLRRELRSLGIADNTLLWYCSDNGALPVGRTDGLRGKKGDLWEGGLRVPAMIEWPARFSEPQTIEAPCTTSDILPTVLAAANVPLPTDRPLDGQNLLPLLSGEPWSFDRGLGFWIYPAAGIRTASHEILVAIRERQAAGEDREQVADHESEIEPVRDSVNDFPGWSAWLEGEWKLHRVAKANQAFEYQLFNLRDDPSEKRNVAQQQPERVERMQRALQDWQTSVLHSLDGHDDEP